MFLQLRERRFWILVHRVNGLALATFLTVVGLTGTLLAFRIPLEHLFAPTLFNLPAHVGPRLDPLAVRDNVAKAFPRAQVDALDLTRLPEEPLEFFLSGDREDDVFADPYTGRILGARRYGDWREGWRNAVPILYNLHSSLALGEMGTLLLGLAALLWTMDCFVGLYLTLPPAPRTPRRWMPSWLIRFGGSPFQRLYDLHRAPGLYVWPLLLVFAWTGVAFNLPVVYSRVMRVTGARPAVEELTTACPTPQPAWPRALEDARSAMAQQAVARGFKVEYERFLSYDPATCRFTYRVRSNWDGDRIGNTQVIFAKATDAVFTAPTHSTKADTLTTWLEAVHEAQFGGIAVRLLVAFTGLITASLCLTGLLIFLRKRPSRQF